MLLNGDRPPFLPPRKEENPAEKGEKKRKET